jgi:hypothetical protein
LKKIRLGPYFREDTALLMVLKLWIKNITNNPRTGLGSRKNAHKKYWYNVGNVQITNFRYRAGKTVPGST